MKARPFPPSPLTNVTAKWLPLPDVGRYILSVHWDSPEQPVGVLKEYGLWIGRQSLSPKANPRVEPDISVKQVPSIPASQ